MKSKGFLLLLGLFWSISVNADNSSQQLYEIASKYKTELQNLLFSNNIQYPELKNIPLNSPLYGMAHYAHGDGTESNVLDINFATDCGLLPPIYPKDETYAGFDVDYKFSESIGKAKERTEGYLATLNFMHKYTKEAKVIYKQIANINEQLLQLVNKDISITEKKIIALPLLVEMEKKSSLLARTVGFNYEGGCGAGDEDSQEITFISKPSAQTLRFITMFDFRVCQVIKANPYNFNQCDAWQDVMKQEPYNLSGEYMLYAEWANGKTKKAKFSALSTKPATIRILK